MPINRGHSNNQRSHHSSSPSVTKISFVEALSVPPFEPSARQPSGSCQFQSTLNQPFLRLFFVGGHRAGSKRNHTHPATNNVKKVRGGCVSPQPLVKVATLQQREAPPSPEPDTESMPGESYISSSDLGSQSANEASDADPSVSPIAKPGVSTINDNSSDQKNT